MVNTERKPKGEGWLRMCRENLPIFAAWEAIGLPCEYAIPNDDDKWGIERVVKVDQSIYEWFEESLVRDSKVFNHAWYRLAPK